MQRTKAGLESARSRGHTGGRPKGLAAKYQKIAPAVKNLYESSEQSTTQIMSYFGIGSRRALYIILRYAGVIISPLRVGLKANEQSLP